MTTNVDIDNFSGILKVKIHTANGQYFKTMMHLTGKDKVPYLRRPSGRFTPMTPLERIVEYLDPVEKEWCKVR